MQRDRISGARLAVIGVLAVIALLAFLVLADVRFNFDDPTVDGLTDAGSRKDMTILLLAIEAICFIAVLVLLLVNPFGARPAQEAPWTSTGGATIGVDDELTIGCPGCGTVFEKPLTSVDEPHEQTFRCPNCGRTGRLRMELRKPVSIKPTTCGNCGTEFQSYRDGAECPACHAAS